MLTLVHGKGDPHSPFVKLEMDEIRQMIDFERQNADVTITELFRLRMLNRLHIGIFTQIWSQLTGMNVMTYCEFHQYPVIASFMLTTFQTLHTSSAWLDLAVTSTSSHPASNTSSTSA